MRIIKVFIYINNKYFFSSLLLRLTKDVQCSSKSKLKICKKFKYKN
ncbi:hypothetical protein A1OE_1234 [Candidatus Endolissoclinum faulkneri L2]|uniref:Uncharacterized protein n=1 Tax=Candidatus Endolissoclinum faulkneri L2 TaxID=1193729 RepID=K7Z5R0_9PROT|nr:hypothetical protein A1OE_1234 [Candidatus Endolissoclinum faulkneri L2]